MAIRLPLMLLAVASAAPEPPPLASPAEPRPLDAPSSPQYIDDTGDQGIQWGACNFNSSVPIECGSLKVPFDYTNPKAGTLDLSLSKIAAVNEPFKEGILFNFGGPGSEAVETLGLLAPRLLKCGHRSSVRGHCGFIPQEHERGKTDTWQHDRRPALPLWRGT